MDLRVPLGSMFGLLGLVLLGYGLLGDQKIYDASLGINVNFWAGLGMTVFAALMLLGARRSHASSTNK